VLRCNRDRDTNQKKIETVDLQNDLPKNLTSRFVRGKIKYMGAFGLPYGYKLSRKNGDWTVTAAIKFKFPRKKTIEVNSSMMSAAGLSCSGSPCTMSNTTTVQKAIMKAWRDDIERVWQLPGFKVDVRVVNLGELSKSQEKAFKKAKAIWPVNFSAKYKRATYYPIPIFKQKGIPASASSRTLVHEFGHWMGLDDEYEEFKSREATRPNLICSGAGGSGYMMCDMSTSIKPVYAWIITRRYLIDGRVSGMGSTCSKGEHMGTYRSKPICAYGLPVLGAECKLRKGNSTHAKGYCLIYKRKKRLYQARALTGAEAKCERGRNLGKHNGKLICEKNFQISYKKCSKKSGKTDIVTHFCVYPDKGRYAAQRLKCTRDQDCSSGQYCWTGVAGIGANQCKYKLADNKACVRAGQCQSNRCHLGRCKTQHECEKSSDCGSGKYCDKGGLGSKPNTCVSQKANGQKCSKKEQCKSGRCYWGKCNDKDACKKDSECGGSKFCDKGTLSFGVNKCKSKRSKGTKCSRKAQCKSNKCSFFKCR